MPIIGTIASSFRSGGSFGTEIWGIAGLTFEPITSTNGITWTSQTKNVNFLTRATANFSYISYLNNRFYAYAENPGGTFLTSTNGTAWSVVQYTGGVNPNFWRLNYANSRFFGSAGPGIYFSTNAINWTFTNVGVPPEGFADSAYGAGVYFLMCPSVTNPGSSYTSTDLVTWTSRSLASQGIYWTSVIFSNDKFVAVGYTGDSVARIDTSSNGITWTTRLSTGSNTFPQDVAFDASQPTNKYVASAWTSQGYYSQDGTSWTLASGNLGGPLTVFAAAGGGTFVLTGYQSAFWTSGNGVSWTQRTFPNSQIPNNRPTYDNTRWYFAVSGDSYYSTSDFVNWTTSGYSGNTTGQPNLQNVTYGNNTFVAAGTAGQIYYSTNMTTWNAQATALTGALIDVAFGDNLWISGGVGGFIQTTTSLGSTWTSRDTGANASIRGIAYVPFATDKYLVCGESGQLRTSTDTITWTSRTTNTTEMLQQFANNGTNTILAVGEGDNILRSTNGVTWTQTNNQTSGQAFSDVAYGAPGFVVMSRQEFGNLLFSTNGASWTVVTNPLAIAGVLLTRIVYLNGLYVISATRNNANASLGSNMPYMTSTNGTTWTSRTMSNLPNYNQRFLMAVK